MKRTNYWHQIAQSTDNIEEKRWCYQRAIEEDEEDYDSRAEFLRLGNGPMRAPACCMRPMARVGVPSPPSPLLSPTYRPDPPPEPRRQLRVMDAALKLAVLAAALATTAAGLAICAAVLRMAGFI